MKTKAIRESVATAPVVRLCRRYKPEGQDFRLIPQHVCWSGDTIDVCSVCGMDVYDKEWPKCHSDEMVEAVRCPRCNAPEKYDEERTCENRGAPGTRFDCGTTLSHSGNWIISRTCHVPHASDSREELFQWWVSEWRFRKSTVIAKEIESWERYFQRHSGAYAKIGASCTPPGTLPDADKVLALKEAYNQAKEREDYNALVEAHFLPTIAKPSRHTTKRRLRR